MIPFLLKAVQLVFWDTSSDFIETIGITAAVIFFVYFVFHLIDRKIR